MILENNFIFTDLVFRELWTVILLQTTSSLQASCLEDCGRLKKFEKIRMIIIIIIKLMFCLVHHDRPINLIHHVYFHPFIKKKSENFFFLEYKSGQVLFPMYF